MIEVPYGSVPDDHVSIWRAPLPAGVFALVRELLPEVDVERIEQVCVTPDKWEPHGARVLMWQGSTWRRGESFMVEVHLR